MKKKKIHAVLALVLMTVSLGARDFRFGGLKYNIMSEKDSTCEVTFNGKEYYDEPYSLDTVVIPEYAFADTCRYKVVRIGENAFYGCVDMVDVDIPQTVSSIGTSAFQGCMSMTSVTIPRNVKMLPDDVFGDCAKLSMVFLPRGVEVIGNGAFAG